MLKNTCISLLLLILSARLVQGAILTESEATPSVFTEPAARLLMNEINFKNSEADWVELYYESPAGKVLNLKGIYFQDDSSFKKVESDFWISSGQHLLLTFKNEQTDATPYLYTSRAGLTGTTEQFIIYDRNNKIIDAVCWTSSKPTAAEIKDMAELFSSHGWASSDVSSCFPSESVGTNESIVRMDQRDTGTLNDWVLASQITPAAINVIEAEEQEGTEISVTSTAPDYTNIAIDDETETDYSDEDSAPPVVPIIKPTATTDAAKKEAKPKAAKKSKSAKKSSPTYKNGDTSQDIKLSEILPNPKKEDSKNEWIELVNSGDSTVNLGNWQLDDDEKGSKPYTFSDVTVIEAGSTLLIPIEDSKISLANKSDSVRLFNFKDELIDEISYEEAPEEQSYAIIKTISEDGDESENWEWTKTLTPDEPNPLYNEITGKISRVPAFENSPYSFEMVDSKENVVRITFTEAEIAAPLAQATFLKDAELKITGQENEDQTFVLKTFEIISEGTPQPENNFIFPSILGTLFTAGGSAYYFVRRKIKI